MKSIFARPLFINPQAYLTIPELSYIQMATPFDFTEDSYSFKVNTSGRIEGKLLKTSNDYILHLDLYSIDGNCVLGEFYLNNSELNTDNFNLTQSKNIITLQFGEQSSSNITYPGLIAAWDVLKEGKDNEHPDREWIRDLTGHGHDIQLFNMSFSEMSGYGKYWTRSFNPSISITINSSTKYSVNFSANFNSSQNYQKLIDLGVVKNNTIMPSFKLKISGLRDGQYIGVGFHNFGNNIKDNLSNGIHIIPSWKNTTGLNSSVININHGNPRQNVTYKNVTIELLPEYPGALIFDGVDDYGINENMPIQDDFTLILKRTWFKSDLGYEKYIISKSNSTKKGAFILGRGSNGNDVYYSYYLKNDIINPELSGIIYVTPISYNGLIARKGTTTDTNVIYIGTIREPDVRHFEGAFYCAYLFDRSLDEQEIKSFIRKYIDSEYVLPSEAYLILDVNKLNINKLK